MIDHSLHKPHPATINGQLLWPDRDASFVSPSGKEAIIFSMYTDYHREHTYHFYTNEIPQLIVSKMGLNYENGDLVDDDTLKSQIIATTLTIADSIPQRYFQSNFGFSLGDSPDKAKKLYGNPHRTKRIGRQLFEYWSFQGLDFLANADPPVKPDSHRKFYGWGFSVAIEFIHQKAVAIIFSEGIP